MAGEQDIGKDGGEVRFDRTDQTAESTAEDSVIAGDRKDHQQRHQEMKDSGRTFQGMNKLGEQEGIKPADYESVTIVALTEDGEVKASGKTGFKEKDLEQAALPTSYRHGSTVNPAETAQGILKAAQNAPSGVGDSPRLLTSNVAPNAPNLDQSRQFEDVQTDASSHKGTNPDAHISHSPFNPLDHTPIESGEVLRPALEVAPEVAKMLTKATGELVQLWMKDHPLKDRENEIMADTTKGNPTAWEDAKDAFPQLKDVPIRIMKAYTRNEIVNYNRFDLKDDIDAAKGEPLAVPGRPADQATLGISQITEKGVREFEERYPKFKEFLESKGYTGPGHEKAALLDPECAPMIVAAKTTSIIEDMQKHGIEKPSLEQIAYAYNPDVYSYSDSNGGERIYKTMHQPERDLSKMIHPDQRKEYYAKGLRVIRASEHVRNVMNHLQ